ncbi:MAG: four helix bundle protein [Flavobacteriales bacterium]|jgi:four helix bundle protein|nr:four helix bundle protein [Flavobacteriales bacterium]MCB0757548.1 four helix bundle protein [Flavobacteriales bacterium]
MKDFKKHIVWQKSMNLTDLVFDLYEGLPWHQVSELKRQATRSAISIPSNIAEGNSRRSEKDKHRFMEIALGSSLELETRTLILQRRHWAPQDETVQVLRSIEEQQKMLQSFMNKLKV